MLVHERGVMMKKVHLNVVIPGRTRTAMETRSYLYARCASSRLPSLLDPHLRVDQSALSLIWPVERSA